MITIRPFAAIRPTRDKVSLVGSRSYLEYTTADLKDKLENNPYTFLHVINPDYQSRKKLQGRAKFKAVKQAFEKFMADGIFQQDQQPAYYLYRQMAHGAEYLGIIAGVAVADYQAGKVKVHEHTLTEREEMFRDYLDETGFNAEPVLLTHPRIDAVEALIEHYLPQRAEYEFTSTDRVTHHLWVIQEPAHIHAITQAYAQQEAVYIADGHHRSASSALLAQHRGGPGNAPHQFFMSILVPETHLKIWEFNRMVQSPLPLEELLQRLQADFTVQPCATGAEPSPGKHRIHMLAEGQWYALQPKPGTFDAQHPVQSLECQILSDLVLAKIMGIADLKTDKRVAFVPGTEPLSKLPALMERKKCTVAFVLPAVTFDALKAVADAGLIMPPKSTYIEPKLRSGMTIYPL